MNTVASRIAKNGDALKKYGVSINDSNGNLRSTYDILGDLKPKWDKLTNSQKVSLGNTLAGVNQYKVFAAVMGNFGKAQEATNTALNSSGSAAKENKKQLESLEGRINELKAAFQELVLGNGGIVDVAKWFIQAGTAILKFANSDVGKAVIKLTALSGILLGVARATGALSKAFTGIKGAVASQGLLDWIVNGKKVEKEASKVGKAGKQAGKGIQQGAILGTAALSTLAPVLITIGGLLAVVAATAWWEGKPARDYKQASKDLSGLKQKLANVTSEKEKLEAKSKSGGLTESEKNRLKVLEAQTKELEKQIEIEAGKKTSSAEGAFTYTHKETSHHGQTAGSTVTKTDMGQDAIDKATKSLSKLSDTYGNTGKEQKKFINYNKSNIKNLEKLNKEYANNNNLTDKQKKNYKKVREALIKYAAAGGKVSGLTKSEKAQVEELAKHYNAIKKLSKVTSSTAIPTFKKLGKEIGVSVDKAGKFGKINITKFAKSMKEAGYSSEETKKYLEQVIDAGGKIGNIDVNSFESKMKDAGFSAKEILDYLQTIGKADPTATVTLDGAKVAINDLKVVDGKLVAVDKKTAKPQVQLKAASFFDGIKNILSSLASIPKTKTVKINEVHASHATGTQHAEEELAVVNDNPSGGVANGKFPELIKRAKTGKMFIANNGEETVVQLHSGDKVYTAQETRRMMKGMPHYAKGKSAASQISTLEHQHNMGTLSDEQYYKKLTKLNDKYYKHSKKHLSDYRSNLEAVYSYEENKYKDVVDDKIEALGTESGATEQNFNDTLAYIKKLRKQHKISKDTYNDLIKQYYEAKSEQMVKNYQNEKVSYADSLKLLKQYLKEGKISYSDYYSYVDDLNDAQLEKQQNQADIKGEILNWYAEQQQKIIENQITQLENQKDALEAAKDEEDSAKELAELEQNLADAKSTRIRVFKDGQWQYVEDTKAVKEAQDSLDDYKSQQAYDKQIDNIDKQIDALQDQSDAWSDYVDEYEALQTKLENEQELGMTYEQFILDNRITNIQSFTDAYAALVEEQVALAAKSAQAAETINSNSASSSVEDIDTFADSMYTIKNAVKAKKANGIKLDDPTVRGAFTGYASGSDSIPENGVYNFNEMGDELFVPRNLNYASKGSGVIPHTMSENLKDIGSHSWNELKSSVNDNHSVNINTMTVKADNPQDFLRQMKNLVNINN